MTEFINREEKNEFLKALAELLKSDELNKLYGRSFEPSLKPVKAVSTAQLDRIVKMMQGPVLEVTEKLKAKDVVKKSKKSKKK